MDATLDFLEENRQRRFPLDQDCLPVDVTGTFLWPDGALLDARGWSRLDLRGEPVYLAHFTGHAVAHTFEDNPFEPDPAFDRLYFGLGGRATPTFLRVDVPAGFANFPAVFCGVVADPDYPGLARAGLEVTLGAAFRDLSAVASLDFDVAAPLEPGCVHALFHGQVDRLRLLRVDVPGAILGGDVVLRGGHATEVGLRGQTVTLDAVPGGGPLGGFVDLDAPGCADGLLTSLSGVAPDARGRFTIGGGPGVKVENFPAEYRVRLTLDPATLGGRACAAGASISAPTYPLSF